MSMYRLVAGLVGLALVAAVVAVGVGVGSEVKAESAPTAVEDSGWGCAPEPWPYGCQWRTPGPRRVIVRTPRPS
jgi:hypothetical protein